MMSDRTLHALGMRPEAVALWGDVIRGTIVLMFCLMVASFATAYVETVRRTVTIRDYQDFGTFYDSALVARSESERAGRRPPTVEAEASDRGLNLNPPHFTFVMLPFTFLDLPRAFAAWLGANALALVASIVVICRRLELSGWAIFVLCVLCFASAPMIATLATGQVGLVLLFPFTMAWACARRNRHIAAGVWMGVCAAIKPFLLLFVVYWALTRRIGAALVSLASTAALFGIGLAYFGIGAYRAWIDRLSSVTWAEQYLNASVLGFVERTLSASEWQHVPVADWPSLVGPTWALICAGIGIATLSRVRSIASVDGQFLLIMVTALLLSPLAWIYYLWFLAAPVAGSVSSSQDAITAPHSMLTGFALATFLVPLSLPSTALQWWGGFGTATFGSIYFWGLVALWVAALRGRPVQEFERSV